MTINKRDMKINSLVRLANGKLFIYAFSKNGFVFINKSNEFLYASNYSPHLKHRNFSRFDVIEIYSPAVLPQDCLSFDPNKRILIASRDAATRYKVATVQFFGTVDTKEVVIDSDSEHLSIGEVGYIGDDGDGIPVLVVDIVLTGTKPSNNLVVYGI